MSWHIVPYHQRRDSWQQGNWTAPLSWKAPFKKLASSCMKLQQALPGGEPNAGTELESFR
jgi:hypothetical protein